MSFGREGFRLQLNRSREDLGNRSSLESPTSPLPSKKHRNSRLFTSITGSDLADDTDAHKPTKHEKTKAMLKKVFGGKQAESKRMSTALPHIDGLDHKESLSKRKAPDLTITIMPKPPPTPPVHKIFSQPSSSSPPYPPSPTNSSESASFPPYSISPTLADFDPALASPSTSPPRHSSDSIPSPSRPGTPPRSHSPSPHLPYLMQHLSASREALAREESNNASLERQKSLSSPSLNDMYRAQTSQDLTKHRPAAIAAATHTMDGIRIPQNLELESGLEPESPRRKSVPAGLFRFSRSRSPVRTSSPARPASYGAPLQEQTDGKRQLNLAELTNALGGWDFEADVEEAQEHLIEMKRRAMESEERKRRSWDLAKDWNSWTPAMPVSTPKKEVKWSF